MENNNINIIKDFLSKKDCDKLIELYKNGNALDLSYIHTLIENKLNENFKFKGHKLDKLSSLIFKEYNNKTKYTLKWKTKNDTYFTILVQLNDDFKNGYQQFLDDDENYYQVPKLIGSLVFFFSNIKHRIAPVVINSKYVLECEIKLIKDETFKKTLI